MNTDSSLENTDMRTVLAIVPTITKRSGAGRLAYETLSRIALRRPVRILAENMQSEGSLSVSFQLGPRSKLGSFLRNCLLARRAARGTAVVHAYDAWPYGFYGLIAVLGTRRRLIVSGVGTYAVAPLYSPRTRWLVRAVYRRAAAVPCISVYTKARIDDLAPGTRTSVVHMGSTALPKPSPQAVAALRERLAIPSDAFPIVLTVGEIKNERKGQIDVLRGLIDARSRFPRAFYLAVGTDAGLGDVASIRALAADAGMADHVCITPDIRSDEELAAAYSLADVFALTSRNGLRHFEGFGLVFLEAAQFGVPGIGTLGSGIEDAIEDGVSGVLVPEQNPAAFARALEVILADLERFRAGARQWYTRFSWDTTAERLLALYDRN